MLYFIDNCSMSIKKKKWDWIVAFMDIVFWMLFCFILIYLPVCWYLLYVCFWPSKGDILFCLVRHQKFVPGTSPIFYMGILQQFACLLFTIMMIGISLWQFDRIIFIGLLPLFDFYLVNSSYFLNMGIPHNSAYLLITTRRWRYSICLHEYFIKRFACIIQRSNADKELLGYDRMIVGFTSTYGISAYHD
jgi:hypothetical protein